MIDVPLILGTIGGLIAVGWIAWMIIRISIGR